jgi:kumamolisin
VYFAPNTDAGFVAAVSQAIHDAAGVTVMSISWGSAESSWTSSSTAAFDAALADAAAQGITVCVASGDNGSADGQSDGEPHADFPASSPHALGCGGTRLPSSGVEVVWNDGADGGAGGGGFSTSFPVPAFQRSLTYQGSVLPGRGVPDVSADADPETGYRVRIDGTDTVIGGTSAAAPLWAALIARIQQASGEKRWLTPLIYALPAGTLFDVTSGDNGAYAAGPGWDPCSGLGTPAGGKLGAALETSLETSP